MEALQNEGGFSVSQGAIDALRATYRSGRASEAETRETITNTRRFSNEILCPHSAVGVKVARENLGQNPMVTLATAHPAKFPDAVESATGFRPPLPKHMADLYDRPERVTEVKNDLVALQTLIKERLGQ